MDAVLCVVDLPRTVAFYLLRGPAAVAAEIVIADPPVRREETPIKLVVQVAARQRH